MRHSVTAKPPIQISPYTARHIWLEAQRLTAAEPFGSGPDAVARAIEHLGYVQIDTINVIERCHHHILFSRIPEYQRTDLAIAQSDAKTVFEYWTHALSYLPVSDMRYYTAAMKAHRRDPAGWGGSVSDYQFRKLINRIRDEGPLAISDIKDDRLVEKEHLWASRKPSKRALQSGFYSGRLVISRRQGMLKTYELTERHFGWERLPKPASPHQTLRYVLDRALRTQGVISLDSVCFNNTYSKPDITKPDMAALIEKEVKGRRLVPVTIAGLEKVPHYARPETLEAKINEPDASLVHILSPFDPLIIQRKRTAALFGYQHLFEAYVPEAKRQWGYFALPVLVGDEIVAALDLKADRQNGKLLIQNWVWMPGADPVRQRPLIETALDRFEKFQFGT